MKQRKSQRRNIESQRLNKAALLSLCLIASTSLAAAGAARTARADGGSEVMDDVRVLLPSGDDPGISSARGIDTVKAPTVDGNGAQIGLDISSWSPSNMTLNSQVQDATPFTESGIPAISGSYIGTPLLRGRAGTASLLAGVGLARLSRSGTVEVPGSPQSASQTAYLIPVELGFELRPSTLQWRRVGVLFDAGILPTLMLTERSPFDDGRTLFGLPARFLVGGSYDVRGLVPVSTPTFFELGVSQTVGSVSEGGMNGTGILAGVRVAI